MTTRDAWNDPSTVIHLDPRTPVGIMDQWLPKQAEINRALSRATMPNNLFLQLNSDGVELNPELIGLTGRARELTKLYPPRRVR